MNKSWILPEENAEGYIESSDKVLGVLNLTDPYSNVTLEPRIIPISEGQIWYRGTANKYGWFVVTNPYSGHVLTAVWIGSDLETEAMEINRKGPCF